MEQGGNDTVNQIFEAKIRDTSSRVTSKSDMKERQEFCRKKYVDRKYYSAAEYLMAIKKIRTIKPQSTNQPVSRLVNPFSRNDPIVSQVPVDKQAISDADFFKSMSKEEEWIGPFEEDGMLEAKAVTKKDHQNRKTKKKGDGLSRSWHPESPPAKTDAVKFSNDGFEKALQSRKSNPPRRSASLLVGNVGAKQKNYLEEDDTVFDSIHTPATWKLSDSVATVKTVTNTSRRPGGRNVDPLSSSCHVSMSISNRARPNDLSKSLHGKASKGMTNPSLVAKEAPSQVPTSAKSRPRLMRRMSTTALQTDPVNQDMMKPKKLAHPPPITTEAPSRPTESSKSRPRMMRRMSTTALQTGSMNQDMATPKKSASDLVVDALVDFLHTNPEVTKALATAADLLDDNQAKDKATQNHQENADTAPSSSRTPRARRSQRTTSTSKSRSRERSRSNSQSRSKGRSRSNSRSRSHSRSRANSRSRRAALMKRVSNNKGANSDERATRPSRRAQDRKSRRRSSSSDEHEDGSDQSKQASGSSLTGPEGMERSMPFGSSRHKSSSKSRERPDRSRSGSHRNNGRNRSKSTSASRRRGSQSGRASSASGRARRQLKRSSSSDEMAAQLDDLSVSSPEAHEFEACLQAKLTENVPPTSPTVSEASTLVDDL
ncbi:MAG: hypothetical protein SGILL_005394 [Bacillariaceae sp.]